MSKTAGTANRTTGRFVFERTMAEEAALGRKRYSGRGTKRQIFTTRGRSWLSRAEILGAIRDGYGVAMSSNTATVTLNRMQRAGVIRLDGWKSWSLSG